MNMPGAGLPPAEHSESGVALTLPAALQGAHGRASASCTQAWLGRALAGQAALRGGAVFGKRRARLARRAPPPAKQSFVEANWKESGIFQGGKAVISGITPAPSSGSASAPLASKAFSAHGATRRRSWWFRRGEGRPFTFVLAPVGIRSIGHPNGICRLNQIFLVSFSPPMPFRAERTGFIQWRTATPAPRCAYVAALVPRTKKDALGEPSFRILEAAGGWAVEVKTGTGIDVVMFRSERSKSVAVAEFSTRGSAALMRKPSLGPGVVYLLGN